MDLYMCLFQGVSNVSGYVDGSMCLGCLHISGYAHIS